MNWKLAVTGGVLLGIGFVISPFWPFVFLGFVPFLEGVRKSHSWQQAFVFGWIAGSVLNGSACYAIWWHTLPLQWLGVFDPWFQVLLIAVSWALTSAGLGLGAGVCAALFKYLSDNTWRDYIYFASAWVVCEWLSAWWFSIQNYGPGMVVAPDFSLGFLGNLLANDNVVLQFAWFGGVYALSAVAVLVGTLLCHIRHAGRRERNIGISILAVLATGWLCGYVLLQYTPSHNPDAAPVRIAAISLQRPPTFVPTPEQNLSQYSVVMRLLPNTVGASLVVLPESSEYLRTLRSIEGRTVQSALTHIYGATGTVPVVIDSESLSDNGTLRDRLEFYDSNTGTSRFQNKRFLLPGGEYIPLVYRQFFRTLGQGGALQTVLAHRGFTAGGTPSPMTAQGIPVGALFCDETMSPYLYHSLARQGATLFINVASHSWFHGSHIVAAQMENAAKIRAVESRRWYVQASDVAPSFILDPYGRVVARSQWGNEEAIETNVYERTDVTPYTRIGNWLPMLLMLLLSAAAIRKWKWSMIS